jgi:hypothetical protein
MQPARGRAGRRSRAVTAEAATGTQTAVRSPARNYLTRLSASRRSSPARPLQRHSTVSEYVNRAKVVGITWPISPEISDAESDRRLFTPTGFQESPTKRLPDWTCRRSTGGRVHPGDGCSPDTGGAARSSVGQLSAPSARMCKRCTFLTELRRDRAEVSLFQWRKRRHIYRVTAAYAVVAWVLSQLVRAELLGGITCVISLGRSP